MSYQKLKALCTEKLMLSNFDSDISIETQRKLKTIMEYRIQNIESSIQFFLNPKIFNNAKGKNDQ